MNSPFEPISVEQVLEAYVAASAEPRREILAEWIARYPQYKQDLIDFTVAWIQSNRLPARDGSEIDSGHGIQIGMEAARRVYAETSGESLKKPPSRTPLVSFLQEAKLLGLSGDDLARHLQLSMALLRKLENRLLLLETIPLRLIEQMARALQRGIREISSYLAQPAMMPGGIRLKARQRPAIPDQESFFEAVRADDSLEDEQRNYWLSFEEKGE